MANELDHKLDNKNNIHNFDKEFVKNIDNLSYCRAVLLKMFDDKSSHDVTLISGVDALRISAHRKLLCIASEYFADIIVDTVKSHQDVTINAVNGETLESLIKYCYSGQIQIMSKNAYSLFEAASTMKFVDVQNECKEFLIEQLMVQPENCLDIYLMAERTRSTDLMNQSVRMACQNFEELSNMLLFGEMDYKFLKRLLLCGDLIECSDEVVFETAMDWVMYSFEERKQFTPDILRLIRLAELDVTYLYKNVMPFCETVRTLKLLNEALFWKSLPECDRSAIMCEKGMEKQSQSKKLVVVGGNSDHDHLSIETFCTETYTWQLSKEKVKVTYGPIKIYQYATTDDHLYIVGRKSGEFLLDVLCVNLQSFELTTLPPMNTPRTMHSISVINNLLYAVGGFSCGQTELLRSIERYDPHTKQWTNCAPMLNARAALGTAVLNNLLYAIGSTTVFGSINSVERYDPNSDTWEAVASMNYNRKNPAVAVLNRKIYVLGGRATDYDKWHRQTVETYDPKTNKWTMIASLPEPRDEMAVVVFENELFVVGGQNTASGNYIDIEKDSVERYNEKEQKWIRMKPMNRGRLNCAAIVMKK